MLFDTGLLVNICPMLGKWTPIIPSKNIKSCSEESYYYNNILIRTVCSM